MNASNIPANDDRLKSCNARFDYLRYQIRTGTTRHKIASAKNRWLELIDSFELDCGVQAAEFLRIDLADVCGEITAPAIVMRLAALTDQELTPPYVRAWAFAGLAKWTLHAVPILDNFHFREQALDLARQEGMHKLLFFTFVNWASAHIYHHDRQELKLLLTRSGSSRTNPSPEEAEAMRSFTEARDWLNDAIRRLHDASAVLSDMSAEHLADEELRIPRGRLVLHFAKIHIRQATPGGSNALLLHEVNDAYKQAIELLTENDHQRNNIQIEWAEELLRLHENTDMKLLQNVHDILNEAHASLDTHNRDQCRAYYHKVEAHTSLLEARALEATENPVRLLPCLRLAHAACQKSVELYRHREHPYEREVEYLMQQIIHDQEKVIRPRRVFLSHKTVDKPIVQRFAETLEVLGYEPWLDDDAMVAGKNVDRSVQDGFKQSCGAVFFITSAFVDERYLAAEIEYALIEQRERPNHFRIIILVMPGKDGGKGRVPGLLSRFKWVEPTDELHALREIVRALPLQVGIPRWPD